ncbi:Transmembrane protein 19 [Phytophthora boehmeriae]|uniref:Transmembrane protein 19 n=1 Tax=Phytophthora boehmeriae TaxID=109152 RepID=A0A8T1VYW3_9STRA|nr:Transmembrane protein 19 [Phytophthora boehmeriae]
MSDHSSVPSHAFIGSTMLPPMTFSDKGVADESFHEARLLYEDFLYQRNRSLDPRWWKHIKTKDTIQVYRQRSGHSDTGDDPNTNASVASACSTSSPDTIEDDVLLIGPGSCLSADTEIPVVVYTGAIQRTLDDVMYRVFAHDTKSLRRRSFFTKDGMEDLLMLATFESPTEQNSFDFLGAAWFLYSAGLGASSVNRANQAARLRFTTEYHDLAGRTHRLQHRTVGQSF